MAAKTKLKESDWDVLFPSEEYKIGSSTLSVAPLSLAGVAFVTKHITKIIDRIVELEIDLNNITGNAAKIVQVVSLILTESPEILAEMSGLDLEDIQRLPLDIAVDLFNTCLDVNLKSQENLTKNFQSLGKKVVRLMGSRTA